MLAELLRQAAEELDARHFFRFGTSTYSYAESYAKSVELAEQLHGRGVQHGDVLAVDLANSDDYVFLLFAGSLLGVSFFLLNHRLPETRKSELLEGFSVKALIDRAAVQEIWSSAPRPLTGSSFASPSNGPESVFVRMFTSGTTGRPKAAALTYGNLMGAAESSAAVFMRPGIGDWQLALPMYHVGGLQILVRSLVNRSAFTLYRKFDAPLVLQDVDRGGATHISVVDRMLRELHASGGSLLDRYEVILLGGGPRNERTLGEIGNARLFLSYGMTETCATVAASPLAESTDGGMQLLPGYDVEIVGPDASGFGEVAVSGPGVFPGYVSPETGSPAAGRGLFRDGHFMTGDRGRVEDGRLFVRERLSDMFVSGGENVYPAEIEVELRALPGVVDARIIGVGDVEWGRRPVAFVAGKDVTGTEIGRLLEHRLARFQRPDSVFVLDELPAAALGKVDTNELRSMWERRLDVREVHLYRISQPLRTPFVNSQVTMNERESVIVEVVDHQGRSGFGECVAFSTPWYTEETVEGAWRVLADVLAPAVLRATYLHPREVFTSLSDVRDNLMAKGGIEPACWDLFGRITGEPMRTLLGATSSRALAGVSLGILPLDETIEEIRRYVAKGYTRVKLKIAPGDDVERMSRVRAEFPDLMLMADANQGYTAEQVDVLQGLDRLGLVCIEEPLANATPHTLNALQARLSTPISVDETIKTERDLQAVLSEPGLRNINLKIGKFGGVTPSLDLYRECRKRGITLWLGGMYETGVSKYLHAHFETLEGFVIPGDISETARYFERDIVIPEVRVVNGEIVLPEGPGLAFEPDRERIWALTTDHACITA